MTEVVAAIIWDNDKFMICQRPAHKARGLLWEFVGGKVEPGETKEQALIRECQEELAVTLSVGDVFMDVVHEYPDLMVHLTLFNATIAEGEPQKLEHNDIQWITPSEISNYEFCPADEEILQKIQTDYFYKKHLDFTRAIVDVSDIPNDCLDEHCQDLLYALPNNGKLYKYRSLKGKYFEFAYDSLKQGYMWISTADSLNDDFDSILFGDSLHYQRRIVDYFCQDKDRFIFQSVKNIGKNKWEQDKNLKVIPFELFLKCFDERSGELILTETHVLLNSFLNDLDEINKYFHYIIDFIKNCIVLPESKDFARATYEANRHLCSSIHVFSMSESCDLDNMWGYYSDSGEGFCIEYDFSKIRDLSNDCKKLLLNTYKVRYSHSPKCFDIEAFAEIDFFKNNDPDAYKRFMIGVFDQITSKNITWEHEREWRIVLVKIPPKVFIDIVSGVIIDHRSLNKSNTKKLIRLCRQKGWSIKVRCRSFLDGQHSFIDYHEYQRGEQQLKDSLDEQ